MDCPQPISFEHPGFFDRLKNTGKRIPISGSIEVTQRCNLHCLHCYVGESRFTSPTAQELTTIEIKDLLDQVTAEGCLWMLLTGGEPFLRPDFLDIYSHSRQNGLLTTIFTNGTLITPRIADFLVNQPPLRIEITLYGATQETYERVTGIPGSFDRCLRGIHLLVDRALPLQLKTVLLTQNYSELDEMRAFSDSFGLDIFRFDTMIAGSLDQSNSPNSVRLPPEEIVNLDMSDDKRIIEWEALYESGRQKAGYFPDVLYLCGAGRDTFHIDPTGHLSACILSRARTYDLRSGNFLEGWNEFLREETALPGTKNTLCKKCDKINLCVRCVGRSELEPQSFNPKEDFFCRIGHLRAAAINSHHTKTLKGEASR